MKLVLASTSPRRKEILKGIGLEFEAVGSDVDENIGEELLPRELVTRLAAMKALKILELYPDAVVLGADTVVSIGGKILGKPADEKDAKSMLLALSGKTHEVFSGVAILSAGRREIFAETTFVTFYTLDEETVDRYIQTGEPFDKAGAYGIQGLGSLLVSGIRGDYFNVMGLPVSKTARSLKNFGLRVL